MRRLRSYVPTLGNVLDRKKLRCIEIEIEVRNWSPEQKPLDAIDAGGHQGLELLDGLYAFGGCRDVEAARQRDHRSNDGRAVTPANDPCVNDLSILTLSKGKAVR